MFNQEFSILSIVLLLVVTIVIGFLFSLIKSYLPLFLNHKAKSSFRLRSWLYLSEIIIIITVISIFISYSFSRNIILAIVLILLLLIVFYYLGIFFVKDYLAGLLVKISGEYRLGDQLSIDEINGKITRLGKTQLRIKDAQGNNIYLPYSILHHKIKSLQQQREKINAYSFNIGVKKNLDFYRDIESLQQFIRVLPWIHPSFDSEVKLIEEDNEQYQLRITIYAFNKKYYRKVEQVIKTEFNHK